jgi:HEAT repeat protein
MASGEDAARILQAIDAVENATLRRLAGTQNAFARGPRRTRYVRAAADYVKEVEPARRQAAVDQVALGFGDDAVPFLLKVLDDEDAAARAMTHLGILRAQAAVAPLTETMNSGGAGAEPAIEALGAIGSETSVPAIARQLSSAEHFEAAALALVRIDTPAAKRTLDGLLAQLRRDPRQQSRVEMLERIRSAAFLAEDVERRIAARGRYARE